MNEYIQTCARGKQNYKLNISSTPKVPFLLLSSHRTLTSSYSSYKNSQDSNKQHRLVLAGCVLYVNAIIQHVDMLLYFSSFSQHDIYKIYLLFHITIYHFFLFSLIAIFHYVNVRLCEDTRIILFIVDGLIAEFSVWEYYIQ